MKPTYYIVMVDDLCGGVPFKVFSDNKPEAINCYQDCDPVRDGFVAIGPDASVCLWEIPAEGLSSCLFRRPIAREMVQVSCATSESSAAHSAGPKITKVDITPMPRPLPDGMFDPMPDVVATFDDESIKTLFSFFPDELTFSPAEFVGLTAEEAIALRDEKDVTYMRS